MKINRFWFCCLVVLTPSAICSNTELSVNVTPNVVEFPEDWMPSVACDGTSKREGKINIDFYVRMLRKLIMIYMYSSA